MNLFLNLNFLVVDDDEMLREVVADIFKSEGAMVTEAANGHIAFALVKKNMFDVVFSDIRMPAGDGIELAKNISELPGQKPLVFVCSGFNDLNQDYANRLNILKVFEKPFENSDLIQEVSKWLRQSKLTKLAI